MRQQSQYFWTVALGVPLLGWGALGFVRALLFFGQASAADGWDDAREADGLRRVRRGRRSLQVLSVSARTALRDSGDPSGSVQLDAFLSGTKAIKAQPSWQGVAAIRHSRLSSDAETSEALLLEALTCVLVDLAPNLMQLSEKPPLALLMEIDSGLPEDLVQRVWQQAWAASGIRQLAVPAEDKGLAALDVWLDQRINDPGLLLVVAAQIAPSQPEGTAEAAVGILLGNRLTQTTLAPIAYLHRPELEREPTTEALLYAVRQALDWVPLAARDVEQTWRVGTDVQRDVAINTVLSEVGMPANNDHGLCNLDALLGQPGQASPWLAIAAATQTIERGAGPQLIFSGNSSVETGLWGTVLMPVPPLSK
ncbi:hypothetical protein [Pseudomonas sp. DSP3-2-2]|uniref:hypothetical protein n=1 Tax=unclassified Pseudomonas TaxID=196821 RepID=UPI003CEEA77E